MSTEDQSNQKGRVSVVMYTRAVGCQACKALKEYMARKHQNVQYREAYPDDDMEAMQAMMYMRARSVPVLAIYGEYGLLAKVDGFNVQRVDEIIAEHLTK